jgi:hypothetical protein
MRTCQDKGIFAYMICLHGLTCDMYENPEHCEAYMAYKFNERKLKVASDRKQMRF